MKAHLKSIPKNRIIALNLFALIFILLSALNSHAEDKGWYVQQGEARMQSINTYVDIQPVDTAHAFILVTMSSAAAYDDPHRSGIWAEFVNASRIVLHQGVTLANSNYVGWQVIENPYINVQRGKQPFTTVQTSFNIPLSKPVDPTKSIAIIEYANTTFTLVANYYQLPWTGNISNSTNLRIQRDSSGNIAGNVGWQVVEFNDGSTIQRGQVASAGSVAAPTNVAISSTPINQTWLYFSHAASATANLISEFGVQGRQTSPTNLQFRRQTAGGTNRVQWYAIKTPFSLVQNGTMVGTPLAAGYYPTGGGFRTRIEQNRTALLFSMYNTGATTNFYDLHTNGRIVNSTHWYMRRESTGNTHGVAWQALQFPKYGIRYNQTVLDLGTGNNGYGNLSKRVTIFALGNNSNASIICTSGNCSLISSNFSKSNMSAGSNASINFSCSDTGFGQLSATFSVSSENYNYVDNISVSCRMNDITAPYFNPVPSNQIVEYKTPFLYDVDAYDNVAVSTYSINDSRFSIDSSGAIRNATTLIPMVYTVNISVNDTSGNRNWAVINVTVRDTVKPWFVPVPSNQVVEYRTSFGYDINAVDNYLLAGYGINDSSFTINSTGYIRNATTLAVKLYWLNLTATDTSGNLNWTTISVTVQDTTPPSFTSIFNITQSIGATLGQQFSATDYSGIQSWSINDSRFAINNSGYLSNASALPVALYWLNITVKDVYSNNASRRIFVNITPDTTLPWFNPIPSNQTAGFGIPFSYDVNAFDNVEVDTYRLNDSRFLIDSGGLITNATGLSFGVYWLNISVNDTSSNINWSVIKVNVTDLTAPTITSISNVTVESKKSFARQFSAYDLFGIKTWSVNDSRFSINSTGYLTNTATLYEGTIFVNVTVTDNYNNVAWNQIYINVTPRLAFDGWYVQQGEARMQSINTYVDIQPVDSAHAFIMVTMSSAAAYDDPHRSGIWAEFVNSTRIVLHQGVTLANSNYVGWQVIENRYINVQRGKQPFTAAQVSFNIPLSKAIDPNKAIAIIEYANTTTANVALYYQLPWTGNISNSTNLRIQRDSSGTIAGNVGWQVVEFNDGSTIQRGQVASVGSVAAPTNVGISSTPLNQTWLYFSHATSATANLISEFGVQGRFTSPTNIRFSRQTAGGTNRVQWYAVRTPFSYVQNGTMVGTPLAAGYYPTSGGFRTIIEKNRTALLFSMYNTGATTTFADLHTAGYIVNSTHWYMRRESVANTHGVAWQAAQFPKYGMRWNQTVLDLGTGNMDYGNLSRRVTIFALGNNTDVVITCTSGNCSLIGSNFSTTNLVVGSNASINFSCSDTGFGLLSANFSVSSANFDYVDNISVSCRMNDITAPYFSPAPVNQTVEYQTAFLYDVDAYDNVAVSTYSINDSRFSIDSSGAIRNATTLIPMVYTVNISVNDTSGNRNWAVINITVIDTVKPWFVPVPSNQVVEYRTSFGYDINAVDNYLLAGYGINDSSFTINSTGYIRNATTLAVKVYWLNLTATDIFSNVNWTTISVTVQDTTPPLFTDIYNITHAYGTVLGTQFVATDYSGIQSWSVNDTRFLINNTGYLSNKSLLSNGMYWLNISVMDLFNNNASKKIYVNVTSDTTLPWFNPKPTNQTVNYGLPFSYDVDAFDNIAIDSYRLNDSRFSINNDGLITNSTGLGLGVYWLNISVNDTSNNINWSVIKINVTDLTAPIITSISNTTIEIKKPVAKQFSAYDFFGIKTWSVNDSKFTINSTGYLRNATALTIGTFWLNVTVTDNYNNIAWDEIYITVLPRQAFDGWYVQQGEARMQSINTYVDIQPVDSAHAFILITMSSAVAYSAPDRSGIWAEFVNSTRIVLHQGTTLANSNYVGWQVIENRYINVQRGKRPFTNVQTSFNISLTKPVDPTKSIAIIGYANTTINNLAFYYELPWTGNISNSTNLYIKRDSSANIAGNVGWQVVEFNDGSTIQKGQVASVGSVAAPTNVGISSTPLNQTWLYFSFATTAASNWLSEFGVQGRFTSPTNIQFRRQTATASNRVQWYAIRTPFSYVQNGTMLGTPLAAGYYPTGGGFRTKIEKNRTGLLFSMYNTGGNTAFANLHTAGYIVNSTHWYMRREVTGNTHGVAWQAIQFPKYGMRWNQTVLDLGTGNNGYGNLSKRVTIFALGNNTDVVITCTSGNCSLISSNFSQRSLAVGSNASINFSCSDSGFGQLSANFSVSSGSFTYVDNISVSCRMNDITYPYFSPVPVNQTVEYQTVFLYDIDAYDNVAISTYSINDSRFSIDSSGTIRNATTLIPMVYTVNISVNDTSGNRNWTVINVTVRDTVKPWFVPVPSNQVVEYRTSFGYDINAVDNYMIAGYGINDSSFTINSTGYIRNATTLQLRVYWLNLSAADTSGNLNWTTISVTVQDTTPPYFSPVPVNQTVEYQTPFLYDIDAYDYVAVDSYRINDSRFSIDSLGTIRNASLLIPMVYTVNISVNDTNGNINWAVINITVRDTIKPWFVPVPANQVVEYGTAFGYDINAVDNYMVVGYGINDSSFTINSTGYIRNATTLQVKIYWLNLTATDSSGNLNWTTISVTVIDGGSPIVYIDLSLNDSITKNRMPVVGFNFTDLISGTANCTLFFDNIGYNTTNNVINNSQSFMTVNSSLTDSNYSVYVNCTDNSLNTGKSETIYIAVDGTSPKVKDITPLPGTLYNLSDEVNITANVTDLSGVAAVLANISWPGGYSLQTMTDFNHDNIFDTEFNNLFFTARYNVTIIANDTVNNINNTEKTWFDVISQVPPTVALDKPENNNFTTEGIIRFSYTPNSSQTILNCSLVIDNQVSKTNYTIFNDTINNITQTIAEGVYNWTINCTDGFGNSFKPDARLLRINYTSINMSIFNSTYLPFSNSTILIYNSTNDLIAANNESLNTLIKYGRLYDIEIIGKMGKGILKATLFDVNLTTDTKIVSQIIENMTRIPEDVSEMTPVIAVNDSGLTYNHTLIEIPKGGVSEVNVIMHCTDWNYTTANCTTWEINDSSDYNMQENSTHIWFNATRYTAFGGGGVNTLANLTNITIYDVTSLSKKHKGGTLVSYGMNKSFNLDGQKIYRVEFRVKNVGRQWTILAEDVAYHSGLNSTWGINAASDIWYTVNNGVTNRTGGTFSGGKVSWNLGLGGRINQNAYATFYYIVNITSDKSKLYPVKWLINDSSRNSGSYDYSAYNVTGRDTVPPVVYINLSLNNSITSDRSPMVGFNFTDAKSATANCSLFFNGISYNTTINVPINTNTFMTVNTSLTDSNYSVYINCTDASNNAGKSGVIYITVDATAPAVNNITPQIGNESFLFMPVNITANITDIHGVSKVYANVSWSGGNLLLEMLDADDNDIYYTMFYSTATPGRYDITIIANDTLNNINRTETSWFDITANTSIRVEAVSPLNNSGDIDGNLLFKFSVSSNYNITSCAIIMNGVSRGANDNINLSKVNNISLSGIDIGLYTWTINCTDEYGGNNMSAVSKFTALSATTFSGKTTDFSEVDMRYIADLILENPSYGMVNYTGSTVDLSLGYDLDRYVSISSNYLEVDSFELAQLDMPARISIYNLPYEFAPAAINDDLPCFGSGCTFVSYESLSGNFVFDVYGSSAYWSEANAKLLIYDDVDLEMTRMQNDIVMFYANYSNTTNAAPITGVEGICTIWFSDEGADVKHSMAYDSDYMLYVFNRTFETKGMYDYNITCDGSSIGYEIMSLADNIEIGNAPGYIKEGYCTGEFISKGTDYVEGYLHRGDLLRIYCETPEDIKGGEEVKIIIIPKNGIETTKTIMVQDVITNQYERIYP
jgi:hypothetical protein